MYTQKNINFTSSGKHAEIEAFLWLPNTEPIGIVQIVHGMSESVGRYKRFIYFMLKNGFAVCGHNHLGHGLSLVDGLYGYFGGENSHALLVEDVRRVTKAVKTQLPALPYFLLGHSMGSFVARLAMAKFGDEYSGVIISGTAGDNPEATSYGKRAAALLKTLKGGKYVSLWLDRKVTGSFSSRHKKKSSDTEAEPVVMDKPPEENMHDSHMGFPFTVGAYKELFTLMEKISSVEWAESVPDSLPILLLSGDQDPVGGYGNGVRQVCERLQSAGVTDVTLELYKGGKHEMLNEANYEDVQDMLLRWMEERL